MVTMRRATEADTSLIAWQRRAMFEEAVLPTPSTLEAMQAAFEPWVRERLRNGTYVGWIAEEDDGPVGGAGLWVMDFPPHFLDPYPARGYLLNFYVAPAHRGRGLARQMLEAAIDESRARGLRVVSLHASRFGRPVYERRGFRQNNEMLFLTDGSGETTV